MPPPFTLKTSIEELYKFGLPRFGQTLSHKLALEVASQSTKRDSSSATVEDLLSYLPMRYEDRSSPAHISDLTDGIEASLELEVKIAGAFQVKNRRAPGRSSLFIFEVTATDPDRTGRPIVVWWFVSGTHAHDIIAYYTKRFTRGARFITFGRWDWDKRRATFSLKLNKPVDELEMLPATTGSTGPTAAEAEQASEGKAIKAVELDPAESNVDPALAIIHSGRRVPVYRKLGDLSSKRVREIMHAVLALLPDSEIPETLPAELLRRRKLIARSQALREIHFPTEETPLALYDQSRSPAHLRLIFEDFFWVALGISLKRGRRVKEAKGTQIKLDQATKLRIGSVLPFKLTDAQRRVVKEIFKDLQSDAPMNRLLQGDVGSGKTIVALIAMLATMENGYQTALMVPTEILAEQHSRNIKRLLAKSPYRVELLTGSLRAAEKRKLQVELAAGEIHACIGTHAIIQETVTFKNLGLAVIDEQHRFGVMQRAELRARGFNPDVLVMTATPIPRSLTMTIYGDLDVSVIDEMPPGRTPIETRVIGEEQRPEVKQLIADEVKSGRQIYVVYPLVEESEKMDLKDATQRYEYLRDKVFPKLSIGLVHGKMKTVDKEEVMRRFVAGEIQILVSTTVIEVGVDVPNASVMIVEHAERFGLSQLHQLRGRVGRGAEKSYCVLLTSDKQTAVAVERLGIMAKTNDGFVIAEKDLELRGPGELLGTRQSGLPEFRVANLVRDQQFIEGARKEAEFYLAKGEKSAETVKLIERVRSDARFGLAAVG
ncbi:MAG TPA: ATP-dependent DNA helicase RecG [Pyrinomonadaceae bacterium]|jgi:ATP-dependent DNA helicase RecG|nr:ATP-dependent DNA helicase RecG [Pyrinomonadaceae bacterium]